MDQNPLSQTERIPIPPQTLQPFKYRSGTRQESPPTTSPTSSEPQEKRSLEQHLKEIAGQVKCPLAHGKLYLSVIIGDPTRKRQIVVDCPAKASIVRRSGDKRVHQAYVEEVCCSPKYNELCDFFIKFFNR